MPFTSGMNFENHITKSVIFLTFKKQILENKSFKFLASQKIAYFCEFIADIVNVHLILY